MSYYKEVCRCVNCGKIYSNGVPTICYKCGVELGSTNEFSKFFLGEERIVLNENCEKVIAKRTIFGWKIKKDIKNANPKE